MLDGGDDGEHTGVSVHGDIKTIVIEDSFSLEQNDSTEFILHQIMLFQRQKLLCFANICSLSYPASN